MFRFTIRDVLWLMVVVGLALGLMIVGQQGAVASLEGNACTTAGAMVALAGITRIYRRAQSRR
jgi:hypothetical protein